MTSPLTRFMAVCATALALALCVPKASAIWPGVGTQKREYTIHGFLDRAPKGAKKLDQVTITAPGLANRELVIGRYGSPGDVPPFAGTLARAVVPYWTVYGPDEERKRLFSAPEGAEVEGTFVVTPGDSGSLYIVMLAKPE